MRGCRSWTVAVPALSVCLILSACSDDPNEPAAGGPVATYLGDSGCLGPDPAKDFPPDHSGYILWTYDANTGTLMVNHLNAGLNCCSEFTASLAVTADALRIVETEDAGPCDCTCLYQLGFTVTDLPVGVYDLSVQEEYLMPEDPPLAGTIDLTRATFGTIQAPRGHYPWGEMDAVTEE